MSFYYLAEAFKIAFNDRALYMGDPAYVDVPIGGLTSKEYAKKQAEQIQLDKATVYEEVSPWTYEHKDTTHFSVADKAGNMVAVTQTHNLPSGVAMNEYGFILNNEMDDFSADPESPNAIAPGKTPLSSMGPTVVLKEDGTPFMVLGTPGATRIITTVTQIISNVIDHDMRWIRKRISISISEMPMQFFMARMESCTEVRTSGVTARHLAIRMR